MAQELAIRIIEKSSTMTGGKSKSTGGSAIGGLGLKLGAVVATVLSLKTILSPILKLLQTMMTVVFLPLVMVLVSLLRPVLLLALRWFRKNDNALLHGAKMAASGFETIAKGSGSQNLIDYFEGSMEVAKGEDFFSALMALLSGILFPFVAIFSVVKSIFTGEFFTSAYWEKVWLGLTVVWGWITEQLSLAWDGLKVIWDYITVGLSSAWDGLKVIWDWITEQLSLAWIGLKVIWDIIKTSLSSVWDSVKSVWDTITLGLEIIWTSLETVWASFTNGLDTIWTNLKGVFDGIVGAVKSAWDKLQFWKSSSKDDGGRQHGGDVLKTGRYLLHKGERVVPETQVGGMGGAININITGSVNDNNLAEIIRQVSKEMRRAGAW